MIKAALQNSLLVVISLILSILLIEGGLWLFKIPPFPEQLHNIYMPDKENGFIHEPNANSRHSSWEFDYQIKINNIGIRRSDNLTKESLVSIFISGDSQVFGNGVKEQETISYNIESLMNEGIVLNLGVTSYSTIQEIVLINRYLDFFENKPEHLVLVFSVANDYYDNKRLTDHYIGTGRNHQTSSNGYTVSDGISIEVKGDELIRIQNGKAHEKVKISSFYPPEGYKSKLFGWSKLYNIYAWLNTKRKKSCALPIAIPGLYGDDNLLNSEEWRITKSALGSLIKKIQSENIKLHIAIMPTKYQVMPELFKKAGCDLASINLESSLNILEDFAKENNVSYINFLDEFKKLSSANIEKLFYKVDEHLSPYGTKVVAETILKKLL